MITLNEGDLEEAKGRSRGPRGEGWSFAAWTEQGKTGTPVELRFMRDDLREKLAMADTDPDRYRLSFLASDKAKAAGLAESRHVVLMASENGTKPRARGKYGAQVRLGTYEWNEEEKKAFFEGPLKKTLEPIVVQVGNKKAVVIELPEMLT